jgi:hypothetical protein
MWLTAQAEWTWMDYPPNLHTASRQMRSAPVKHRPRPS